jgi:2-aminobenzoate-CoA ligase
MGTAHVDTFARDHLPPRSAWPDLLFTLPELRYPDGLNAAAVLLREPRFQERACVVGKTGTWTYAELRSRAEDVAFALVDEEGLVPGNRVLLHGANSPELIACWFGILLAGGVVVATMPLLRAGELAKMIGKAQVSHAIVDARVSREVTLAAQGQSVLRSVREFAPGEQFFPLGKGFEAVETNAEDVAIIAFTSGTTGLPKGCVHQHRDLLTICDTFGARVLRPRDDDVFTGTPPLAFTFGLGGLAIFPLRFGATATLLENASPANMIRIIETYKATICFTAPTAYRAMMAAMDEGADLSSLRLAVSAGETLPAPVFRDWVAKTGTPILDGIGTTELLHIFISNRVGDAHPGSTGRPVAGYEARVVDEQMREVPRGVVGRLAVRGPTGCRYLADDRQSHYVRDGWNLTGDAFSQDEEGRFHFAARTDDMIVSAGYNIAGPEVEAALLAHPDVGECAVVGRPDEERGQIVTAFVVLRPGATPDEAMVKRLQDHVKASIAPYKYPRAVSFVDQLPKTATGKIQRFRMRGDGR